jgi:hypothetical protein
MSKATIKKQPKKAPNVNTAASPVTDVTRAITARNHRNQLILCIQAGGYCEFDGCPRYLFEHHLTHKRFNLAQMAHIVAFSELGPRGDVLDRPADINNLDNLMLMCHACHKQIDDFPEEFSRETLEEYKKAHEDRIRLLTSASPDRQTSALILTSKIGGQTVKISPAEIIEAVSPRYPATRNGTIIDLQNIEDVGEEFYKVATALVKRKIEWFLDSVMTDEKTNHLSLFALAPIPILVYAGNLLGNKVPNDLFQKHRDTKNWKWKSEGELVRYKIVTVKEGADRKKVALILSLSGKIHLEDLPIEIIDDATIYEITFENDLPHPLFLNQRQDLTSFGIIYQQALSKIGTNHGKLDELHFFSAIPSPIAVLCGQELMPKIDPVLVVYDGDKRVGGYHRVLEVNK